LLIARNDNPEAMIALKQSAITAILRAFLAGD
jgi:hypothetical protein